MSSFGVIQMYSYEVISWLCGYDSGKIKKLSWDNVFAPFVIGGFARSLASTTLYPINTVRMRLQMKTYTQEEMKAKNLQGHSNAKYSSVQYKGMTDAIVKMYRTEGMTSFYKGLQPNLIKIFPSSGLFFVVYELTLAALSDD